jgi:hypothetical protein
MKKRMGGLMEIASRGLTEQGFPRIYRVEKYTRRIHYGFSLFLVAFFFIMTVLHVEGFMRRPVSLTQLIAMNSFFVLFALLVCINVSRRVILYEDSIEVAGWLSTRKLARQEILGLRMGRLPLRAGGTSYYIIVPLYERKELKLPPYLKVDKEFLSWMKAIPKIESEAGSARFGVPRSRFH